MSGFFPCPLLPQNFHFALSHNFLSTSTAAISTDASCLTPLDNLLWARLDCSSASALFITASSDGKPFPSAKIFACVSLQLRPETHWSLIISSLYEFIPPHIPSLHLIVNLQSMAASLRRATKFLIFSLSPCTNHLILLRWTNGLLSNTPIRLIASIRSASMAFSKLAPCSLVTSMRSKSDGHCHSLSTTS